jgi:hypothetical protein
MLRHLDARTLVVIIGLLPFACGDSPTPVAPASPSPIPSAPAPAPTPTPVPGLASCTLPPPVGTPQCARTQSTFLRDLDEAVDLLAQQQPHIFNMSEQRGGGGYKILSQGQFYLGVLHNLEAKGLCAFFAGEELQIKNSNNFDDAFDLVTGDGFVRRGEGSYRGTCVPASFPAALPAPRFPQGDCPLQPSTELACDFESSALLPDLEAALDQLALERPDIFDLSRHAPGAPGNWYLIVDPASYITELRRIILQRGLCAVDDGGEELVIKRSNGFSESFDVFLSGGFVRRGPGAYIATCYPSYF